MDSIPLTITQRLVVLYERKYKNSNYYWRENFLLHYKQINAFAGA